MLCQVKLDGVEKDNATLQQENQILKRDLEMWKAECEYQRQSLESVSQQHVESVKTITRLDAECSRLRIAVNRKLPPGTYTMLLLALNFQLDRYFFLWWIISDLQSAIVDLLTRFSILFLSCAVWETCDSMIELLFLIQAER